MLELTPEQEQKLIKFRKECLEIGLSTKPINKIKTKLCISKIYKDFLNKNIKNYWFCDSPLQATIWINFIKNNII